MGGQVVSYELAKAGKKQENFTHKAELVIPAFRRLRPWLRIRSQLGLHSKTLPQKIVFHVQVSMSRLVSFTMSIPEFPVKLFHILHPRTVYHVLYTHTSTTSSFTNITQCPLYITPCPMLSGKTDKHSFSLKVAMTSLVGDSL
jgi:hypothetical protein